MAFLAPIQYWICGYCSWQAMKNLEREILWKKHARRKSPSQMKIDFLNPSLSNLQCCQKIQRGKYFGVCFGFFFEGRGPFTIGLYYQKSKSYTEENSKVCEIPMYSSCALNP